MVDPYFGFDVTHNHATGTERLLMAMLDEPEWVADIFRKELDLCLSLLQMIWDAGYTFDGVRWPDDMGYKGKPFFSLDIYRALLKPVHRRCIDWAHAKGIKAHLHSCGDINAFVPDLVGMGLDGLHPLEVKAGMDPVHLKRTYGDRLLLHGGINAALWDKPDLIQAEIARVVPVMKEKGGYVFSSDHSVPDSVSLADFSAIIESARRAGSYE